MGFISLFWHLPPPRFYQTIHTRVSSPLCVLHPLQHGTVSLSLCVPHVSRCRDGNTVMPTHSLATSIRAAQPLLVCHLVMWNVRQLASQTSDCFPGFCVFFHILFIFLTCIRCLQVFWLWAVKRALGLKCLMVVTSWIFYVSVCSSNFVYDSGIHEPERERWDLQTKIHHCCERSWLPPKNSPGLAPNPPCAPAPSHRRPGLPGRCRLLRKNEAWMFLDDEDFFNILSARLPS